MEQSSLKNGQLDFTINEQNYFNIPQQDVMENVLTKRDEWNRSYNNRDNFVFYPHEEVIRFVSKFIRKRIGINEFRDVMLGGWAGHVIDLGCGIGHHVIYCQFQPVENFRHD